MRTVNTPYISLFLVTFVALMGCVTHQRVSYQQDVMPIIKAKCIKCHTPKNGVGYRKTGLDLTTYESLMEGSIYGPVISPGNSRNSILNMLVEGRADNSVRMPHDTEQALPKQEIEILRLWVDQGARNN